MAAKRVRAVQDYKQLNSLSSVVMYDTVRRRKAGPYYKVETIITRRKIRYVSISLIDFLHQSLIPFSTCNQ